MKIDETYFKGAETDDSISELTIESRGPSDYEKTITVIIDCGIAVPDIDKINTRCSLLLDSMKCVREHSVLFFAKQDNWPDMEDVYKIGIKIVPETIHNILSAIYTVINSITMSDRIYETVPNAVTITGFGDNPTREMDLQEFPQLLEMMPQFQEGYNPVTQTNTFVFKGRADKKLMRKMMTFTEEFINNSTQQPETVASEISRYFFNVTPIATIEEFCYHGHPKLITIQEVAETLSTIDYTFAMKNRSVLRTQWEDSSENYIQQIAYVRATSSTIVIRPTFETEIWTHIAQNPKKLTHWKFLPMAYGKDNHMFVRFTSPYGFISIPGPDGFDIYYVLVEVNIMPRSITQTLKNYLGITDKKKISMIENFVIEQTKPYIKN